jgi:DNA-binding CsgD family transcriptional regulator
MTGTHGASEGSAWSDYSQRSVGAAAEAVLNARGDAAELKRIFDQSRVPMVIVNSERRFIEANLPARLVARLSLDELRARSIDDVTPPHMIGAVERAWARLRDTGFVAAHFEVMRPDQSRFDILYYALANVVPGLHMAAFAPTEGPGGEVRHLDEAASDLSQSLTRRETELLRLAAEGLSGPELAKALVLSPATVNTHFKNIHEKLQVRTRAGAVAKAMRLGLID